MQNTPHFLWQPSAWLRVRGEDALNFLQGQLTNDLKNLMVGKAVYGLWLNQKGKVVADSFVIRVGEEEFWVGAYSSEAAIIRQRLENFIIADDVTIDDETAAWGGCTFFSEASRAELAAAYPGGVIFRGRRDQSAHWEWIAPKAQWEAARAKQSGQAALPADELERRRIAAGIPAIPREIGPTDLPNEGGLDRDAVSYTKGCYLGQEVMARLKAMGQVRRRLHRVEMAGEVPILPAPLWAGDRQVGELRSAVAHAGGSVGMAMVTLMHVPADRKLALQQGGSAMITLNSVV